jgi:hypothetical protein
VWGSELTSKEAALQGGVVEIAAKPSVKFWARVVVVVVVVVASFR